MRIYWSLFFVLCIGLLKTQTNADCPNAIPLCTTPNFTFYAGSTYGTIDELPLSNTISNPGTNPASTNSGCLLSGENRPQWLLITIGNPGTLEFVFGSGTSANPQLGFYDWAMWPYSPSACSDILNNILPPIRCNWNSSQSGGTGIASSTNIPTGGVSSNYEPPLLVNGCQQYIICISNYSGVNTLVSFQSLGTASLSCSPNCLTLNSPQVCIGSFTNVVGVSTGNLSNVSFSLSPGNLSSPSPSFAVNPSVTTSYTMYASGINTQSALVTQSAVTTVTVYPQPVLAPSFTQATCLSSYKAFNLGLSFNPSPAIPAYTVSWSTIPFGVLSPTQTATSGAGIQPIPYSVTVTAAGGCKAITAFTMQNAPEPVSIELNPPGSSHLITCAQNSINLVTVNASYSYTWSNGVNAPITGPLAVFTTSMLGTWTINAVNPISGCTSSLAVNIGQSTLVPNGIITPTFQTITCNLNNAIPIQAFANPSVNILHQVTSPLGGIYTNNTYSISYTPGGPGTYSYCLLNTTNGCSTCKTFTVTSNQGFPTFSVSSPQNFTLGCTTKSVATININNASATNSLQIPNGGPVSYTLLSPGSSTVTPTGTLSGNSSYSVTVPGTWTVITKDNTSFCETRLPVSVLQNTLGPDISALVPQQILDCYVTRVTLKGQSSTNNISYLWSFPGVPGNLNSDSIVVFSNVTAPSNTLVANYTLTITDNNNTCKSSSVIPVYQNLFKPKALISNGGTSNFNCITSTVVLTNQSSTGIPPNTIYTTNLPIVAQVWEGPSPQEPAQMNSTYTGSMVGIYTLTVLDLNNGCVSKTTTTIADNKVYPQFVDPLTPAQFTLDCGKDSVAISPRLSNQTPAFQYNWLAPPNAIISGAQSGTLITKTTGLYRVIVTNNITGCVANGNVVVVNGTLQAGFEADKLEGFAPLDINFSNTSKSQNNLNINSYWSFGNGTFSNTASANLMASTVYSLAGTYSVSLFARKGTCLDTFVKVIRVDLPSKLEIPNVFTPNGDQVNDFFFFKTSNLEHITLLIYDRWGNKVVEMNSDSGNVIWDGKNQQSKDMSEGTYFYVVKASGKDGQTYNKTGTVSLLR